MGGLEICVKLQVGSRPVAEARTVAMQVQADVAAPAVENTPPAPPEHQIESSLSRRGLLRG